jgi:hypothetical protein
MDESHKNIHQDQATDVADDFSYDEGSRKGVT